MITSKIAIQAIVAPMTIKKTRNGSRSFMDATLPKNEPTMFKMMMNKRSLDFLSRDRFNPPCREQACSPQQGCRAS